MLAVGVVLSGCGAGEPQRPPAPVTASPEAAVADPTPAIPEYTTKLKLTAKEKQAADGAVLTVDRYFKALTKIYQDPSSDPEPLKSLSGDTIHTLTLKTISDMNIKGYKMQGTLRPDSLHIDSVEISNKPGNTVRISTCMPYSDVRQVNHKTGETSPSVADEMVKIAIIGNSGNFRLDSLEPLGRPCDGQ
ncbi:hypothetical protein [Brevibacterium moorei]|uniref:hypothetical protein n=1 Tax=Brevibacterium moorei TaxID=2968457 RepID=UPI00211CDD2A|nr:hypothetical protein [Brevibacterium sp. 68QC2CO]MCQ9386599.1 hypothetical protein [Brevibacterium sp. 68QC2CO]